MLDMMSTMFGLKRTGFAIELLIYVPPERHELLFQLTERQLHVVHTNILIICQILVSALPSYLPVYLQTFLLDVLTNYKPCTAGIETYT